MKVLFHVPEWSEKFAVTDAVGQDVECLRRASGGRVLVTGPDLRRLPSPMRSPLARLLRGRRNLRLETAATCHHFFRARLDLPAWVARLNAPLVLTCVAAGAGAANDEELEHLARALPPTTAAVTVSDFRVREQLAALLPVPVLEHRSVVPPPPKCGLTDLPSPPIRLLNASCPWQLAAMEDKGIGLLPGALRRTSAGATLLWRGPEVDAARAWLVARGAGDFVILLEGSQDVRSLLGNHHAALAVFPAPQRSHAVPLSVLEAWAVGRPAIVSNRMPVADLVREHHGGFAIEPTAGGLAEAIEQLADVPRDSYRHLPAIVTRTFTRDRAWANPYLALYESFRA